MKGKELFFELVNALIVLVIGGFIIAAVWTVSSERPDQRRVYVHSAPQPIELWERGTVPYGKYQW